MDCGPTCVRMISKYYGKAYSLQELRDRSYLTRDGVSLLGISEAAEYIGLKTLACKITSETLFSEAPLPAVLHWNQNHFVVIPPQNTNNKLIIIADPAYGIIKIDRQTFLNSWLGNDTKGTILLFEPTQRFFDEKGEKEIKTGFSFLFNYLKPYKRYLIQLLLSVLLAGLFSLIFPFLTQSLVDYGVNRQDVNYVYLILFSQLLVFLGSTIIEIIRSWILLHINTRININIISDFLIKLLNLPIRYFDTKMIGDIQQRIGDHQRVQNFLTGTTLSTLFSFVNLIVFSIVLAIYNGTILMIFLSFSIASIFWILIFLKRRKELDYKRFHRLSDNQNILFEMITGMQEIKLNNCETAKRWQWERTQAKLYKISIKGLALGQYQQVGSVFFTQLKNILISFISAKAVIDGQMSIGMMLSVSYIIGQMNGPLDQLLGFVQAAQDAKISLDRLGEIHEKEEEDKTFVEGQRQDVELLGSIRLENVSFQFEGPQSPFVLKNLNLTIPKGKVTAIVGSSGSGKTTLMKMLLQFYEPILGDISIGSRPFKLISPAYWRSKVGAVMQEGTVFSDTIANNISLSDERLDHRKLKNAVNIANIRDFIESLPNGYQTKIGNTGAGISTGQKQRLQIARAVYKDPDYLFFDEATSALDANNEKIIIENLEHFFKGKTVLVIAHRLSTVKHADQIVVLEKGEIVETGTHEELTAKRGLYFNLIRNQLELGA
jgi:ATP-binding cassette subfamily B protein